MSPPAGWDARAGAASTAMESHERPAAPRAAAQREELTMDFEPSAREREIQGIARAFALSDLEPAAQERDRSAAFPADEMRGLARLGLLGINVPVAYGGLAAGMVAFSLALQEIARAGAAVAGTPAAPRPGGAP